MVLVQCYNKGCGQKFDPDNNPEDACRHHPGEAIFHDAIKRWSCCKKSSTDFTEFLNTPGCTLSAHSNEKPPEPEKPPVDKSLKDEVIVVEAPRARDPGVPRERPSLEEPMEPLKFKVAASLKAQLDKLQINDAEKPAGAEDQADKGKVEIGTACKNSACKAVYQGEESDQETCTFHPGVPIFHEGLKFWSCCTKRTTEFENFMAQEGCTKGNHRWFQTEAEKKAQKQCRFDWHQTSSQVCLSIYAKTALPEKTVVKANRVAIHIEVAFEGGKSFYEHFVVLREPIIPEQSMVNLLGTKVEVNLRKAEPFQWPRLQYEPANNSDSSQANGDKATENSS